MLADFTRGEDSVRPWTNFSEPEVMLTDDYIGNDYPNHGASFRARRLPYVSSTSIEITMMII